jgi:hypothetical protein
MLAAAIAGACCVVLGVVLMTSAARGEATEVPPPVGPGDAAVFTPATVTGTIGRHCQVHHGFAMMGSVQVPLMLTKTGTQVTVRWAPSAPPRGSSRTCSSRGRARPPFGNVTAVMQSCSGPTAGTGL